MKKFFKPVVYAAAVALVSAGCAKSEDQTDNHKGNDKSTFVEFYADVVKKDGSRATIDVGEGAFTGAWEESDMLAIVPTVPGASQHSGAHKFGYSATHQSFRGELPSSATGRWEYMAFYPHTEITGTIANIPFGNLRVQNGNSFNSAFDALVADCVVCENSEPGKTENGEKVSFDLKRLTSILNFKVTGAGADKVKYLRLSTGSNEPLSAASLDFDLKDGNPAALNADDQSDVIVVGFESGTAPSANNIDALINVPAGTYEDLVFEVITETGQIGSATITRGPAKPLVAGNLYKKEIADMTFNAIPAPAFEWENQDINAIHDITYDGETGLLTYPAAIEITVEGSIAGLKVNVTSDLLNTLGISILDLFNDSEIPGVGPYKDLLLKSKAEVQYKKSTVFDITALVPLIPLVGQMTGQAAPGSIHIFEIEVTDLAGQKTVQALKFRVPFTGPAAIYNGDADLWANTASFELVNIPAEAQSVSLEYRIKGESVWNDATIAENGGKYTASIEADWTTGTNDAGLTVYTVDSKTGVFAKNTYEYQLTVDGSVVNSGEFTPENNGGDNIPYATFEDKNLSCWGENNSNAVFWASGNCTTKIIVSIVMNLCKQGTYTGMGDNYCAKLTSTTGGGMLGAGNLVAGTFEKTSLIKGVVSFGQPYTYTARPTAIRFKYAAKIGTVDQTKHKKDGADPIAKGSPDVGRIFVCIVDWDSRHDVGSGTEAPTGVWDPEMTLSLSEGAIIGYGAFDVNDSQTMQTFDLPIIYYNKELKPSKKYGIVVSCSANKYGDYMNGCKTNVMYVDDFEWVY